MCDYERAAHELRRIADDHPDALADPSIRAVWLTRRAWISYYIGNLPAAISDLRDVVGLARLTGGPMAIHARHFLGRAYRDLATMCRVGSGRLRVLADRSFALSTAGLARIGTQEQVGYAHLREAQFANAFHERERYRREIRESREHLSGTDASWHQSLEEAGDVELHANARRFRAETALFGAWRFGYRRGIAAAHDVVAELVAARSDESSMLLASDHLAASLAALSSLGDARVDDRQERLMAYLDAVEAPMRDAWLADVPGRLAHHEGVFASLSAIDTEGLGAQQPILLADPPTPGMKRRVVGCHGRTSDCYTCAWPVPKGGA